MIHPDTELKYINEPIGYGVFATDFIPEGTITYVKDSLEISIPPKKYDAHSRSMRNIIDKYSYIDEQGNRVVSWDHAKYVNHCCHCNTMSTGYGFEIAIRDIEKGEQITDEYGLFNSEKQMTLTCGSSHCREQITKNDIDQYYKEWDEKVIGSLEKLMSVRQPLFDLIDRKTRKDLRLFGNGLSRYRSVLSLKYLAQSTS